MTATGHGPGWGDSRDFFGPLERSGVLRGILLVIVAVVIGALLMPSATRPALGNAAAASAPTTSVPTTVPPRTSPTTTRPPTTTTTTPANSSIHVLVANGTDTDGAATAVSSFLSGKGFDTLTPVTALDTVSSSEIYSIGGAVSDADAVVAALGLTDASIEPSGTPPPVSSTSGANVVVIVGPDLESRS